MGQLMATLLIVALAACLASGSGAQPLSDDARRGQALVQERPFAEMPVSPVAVDLAADQGPLELWRHTIGHGGINATPLPARVVDGGAKLRPRLIRVFIQEFFGIYPEHGRFDWSRLDPYMASLAATGAKVVAAITIKPKPLFPRIDQAVWQPNDVAEWQRVVAALVKRYSVDRPIVTYWEVGNETDIGENGGCPYLIAEPEDYARYYRMTVAPILAAFPSAKIGGPAVADAGGDYLPRFMGICRRDHLRLDFISWHIYSDDPDAHAGLVARYRELLDQFGAKRPEMLVTEWSKGFEPVSVEEQAFEPRRAAIVAASILAMNDARVDWSFYYHLWDQVCYPQDFESIFAHPEIMYHHWNEVPHRFGLFGVGEEVRPQYFVYWMLAHMGGRRVHAHADTSDIRTIACVDKSRVAVIAVNHASATPRDRIAAFALAGLTPGRNRLTAYRIDRSRAWSPTSLDLLPVEKREVAVASHFQFQVYMPADSVVLVLLDPVARR